jgi:D-arabinose 1-dehydrogenase-like Zn-dependent alcohol dehydrogenase
MNGKAAVFTHVNQPFEIKSYETVKPQKGTALLSLIASGICGTDMHIHTGKLALQPPMILGHEFVGSIEDISEDDSMLYGLKKGDAVIANVATPCGECLLCKNGDDANCLNFQVTYTKSPYAAPHFFGGYAEYNYSPVRNLVKIPEGVDAKAACVFACAGPTVLHAFRLARQAGCKPENDKTAVVQGTGPVGSFAVVYLAALGIKNIVVIMNRSNLERSKKMMSLGATEVLSMDEHGIEGIQTRVKELSCSIGADLVIEASGNPDAFIQGMELLRNRGVYLVPGQYSNGRTVALSPELITFKALHIIGSSQYSAVDVRDYLDFLVKHPDLKEKALSLGSYYRVEEVNTAFEDMREGKNVKYLLHKV